MCEQPTVSGARGELYSDAYSFGWTDGYEAGLAAALRAMNPGPFGQRGLTGWQRCWRDILREVATVNVLAKHGVITVFDLYVLSRSTPLADVEHLSDRRLRAITEALRAVGLNPVVFGLSLQPDI